MQNKLIKKYIRSTFSTFIAHLTFSQVSVGIFELVVLVRLPRNAFPDQKQRLVGAGIIFLAYFNVICNRRADK